MAFQVHRRDLDFDNDGISRSVANYYIDMLTFNLIFHPGDATNYFDILQD